MAGELLSRLFLTALPGFRLDRVLVEDAIIVTASSVQQESPCPLCGTLSSRVYSQYSRHLADLPSGHRSVVLDLAVRRFVCAEPQCSRRIFCERFVDGPSPYVRRAGRDCRVVQHLSVILGGNVGAQLALKLSLPVSASSVLRSALALTVTPARVLEVIGVDDFALRRGQVYGTVIVDLAQGKPIELLPDRSAETLAAWVRKQPLTKVISRDPRAEYEKGVRLGAPNAQQVLDRWHVIKNFREALERQLGRDRKTILYVCRAEVPVPPMPRTQSEERRYEAGLLARQEFFEQVQALSKAGYRQLAITRRLRVSRGRVRLNSPRHG